MENQLQYWRITIFTLLGLTFGIFLSFLLFAYVEIKRNFIELRKEVDLTSSLLKEISQKKSATPVAISSTTSDVLKNVDINLLLTLLIFIASVLSLLYVYHFLIKKFSFLEVLASMVPPTYRELLFGEQVTTFEYTDIASKAVVKVDLFGVSLRTCKITVRLENTEEWVELTEFLTYFSQNISAGGNEDVVALLAKNAELLAQFC